MSIITNIQHFMDHGLECKLPPKAARLRDFLGQIVRVATASTAEVGTASALWCRERVSQKRCDGTILIRSQDVPGPFIFWICSDCQTEGRIEGYRKSIYDLSQGESCLGTEVNDKRLNVKFSLEEYEAWISGDFIPYDLDSKRLAYSARYFEDVVELDAFESDLDILRDCIAADANHEKRRKRQRLMDLVLIRVSDALDAAFDH
jgi:hypothetical protein